MDSVSTTRGACRKWGIVGGSLGKGVRVWGLGFRA